MPKSVRPTRRRNARTAHECGAERSDFGRCGANAQPRLELARGAAAAERSPEPRAPKSERHRPRAAPCRQCQEFTLPPAPALCRSASRASQTPNRRNDASSFESPAPISPFLARVWRAWRHFRWKLRAVAAPIRGQSRPVDQSRRRPRRRRRASKGLRTKTNPAIAGRARAR